MSSVDIKTIRDMLTAGQAGAHVGVHTCRLLSECFERVLADHDTQLFDMQCEIDEANT